MRGLSLWWVLNKPPGAAPGFEANFIVVKLCNYNITWCTEAQTDFYIVKEAAVKQWIQYFNVLQPLQKDSFQYHDLSHFVHLESLKEMPDWIILSTFKLAGRLTVS